jgi:hypothetical protein
MMVLRLKSLRFFAHSLLFASSRAAERRVAIHDFARKGCEKKLDCFAARAMTRMGLCEGKMNCFAALAMTWMRLKGSC